MQLEVPEGLFVISEDGSDGNHMTLAVCDSPEAVFLTVFDRLEYYQMNMDYEPESQGFSVSCEQMESTRMEWALTARDGEDCVIATMLIEGNFRMLTANYYEELCRRGY